MTRLEAINFLIKEYDLESYLEIGVHSGNTLNECIAKNKLGVDPNCKIYTGSQTVICKTSDEFFKTIDSNLKFDIIFIDGLHEANQIYKDITNALNHISIYGFIILHDCNPPTEWHTRPFNEFKEGENWNGNVYKGYIESFIRYGLIYNTIDDDWGVGILQKKNNPIKIENYKFIYNWEYFDTNRKKLLNLISPEEFKQKFKKDA